MRSVFGLNSCYNKNNQFEYKLIAFNKSKHTTWLVLQASVLDVQETKQQLITTCITSEAAAECLSVVCLVLMVRLRECNKCL